MLSLCITHYNRLDLLKQSFKEVFNDPRIKEIVISDDCSDEAVYDSLLDYCSFFPKVRVFRNDKNVGMGHNKMLAILRASNSWCILLDSDNIIKPDYIDALLSTPLYPHLIYAPDYALPKFDYRKWQSWIINSHNIKYFLRSGAMAECCMNTCNYVVNREEYLKVYEVRPDSGAADTIWFNYLWLKAGNGIQIVRGMSYFHRVHEGSGFLMDVDNNIQKANVIKERLMILHEDQL